MNGYKHWVIQVLNGIVFVCFDLTISSFDGVRAYSELFLLLLLLLQGLETSADFSHTE